MPLLVLSVTQGLTSATCLRRKTSVSYQSFSKTTSEALPSCSHSVADRVMRLMVASSQSRSSRQLCNAQLRPTYPRRRYQRVRRPGRDDSTKAGILFAWCRPIWATAAVKLGGRPFGELGPALAWRDDVRENGGALDGVRALPAKERTSRSAAASAGRWDILLGQRRVPPYAAPRRRFARRLSVRSGRHRQRQGVLTPCRF
jgi:hypothetical protein